MFGNSLPFTHEFFSFLNGAAWVSSINDLHVSITALNPQTNPGAERIPHVTRLSLNCGGKEQVLSNRRLRVLENSFNTVQQQFSWSPACGDTVLEISVSSVVLKKIYPGSYGFLAFLHEFKSGKHAFTSNEFKEQAKALAGLGIHWVAMHYTLQGAPDFAAPTGAPSRIVESGAR
jgi:hypothetical protein